MFSVFGVGTTAVTPKVCKAGADTGPGTSCTIVYPWSVGTTYQFDMKLLSNNGSTEKWAATVKNLSTSKTTAIASWSVPSSWGLLDTTTLDFAEYYASVPSCSAQPSASALYSAPQMYEQGVKAPVSFTGSPSTYGPCAAYASATAVGAGDLIKTGL